MVWASVGGGHGEVSRRQPTVLAAVAAGGTDFEHFFIPKIVFTGGPFYLAACKNGIFASGCLSISTCETRFWLATSRPPAKTQYFHWTLLTGSTSGQLAANGNYFL